MLDPPVLKPQAKYILESTKEFLEIDWCVLAADFNELDITAVLTTKAVTPFKIR